MQLIRIALVLLLCTGLAIAQNSSNFVLTDQPSSAPVAPKTPNSFDVSAIDKTADPCTDFFQYACGNWRNRWNRLQFAGVSTAVKKSLFLVLAAFLIVAGVIDE